ncbi:hypothetical protein Bhyg_13163 [Pseudolycoriella hygida]|uniref:Uncharacterized protein n=1 Tax=Pseudolycoriella hygida TaxID=35572 RepID=A0A9Q0RW76_9DIPT|nr:hypothetical protein Bhyg_13163 [Pseudolycoriella hygida]
MAKSLRGIEEFMRNDFSDVMIGSGETTKDYLGYYWRCQDKFKLVGGQISMISNIAKECRKLYETEINKLNTNEDALCTQVQRSPDTFRVQETGVSLGKRDTVDL